MKHPKSISPVIHRALLSSAIASILLISSPQVLGQSASSTLKGEVIASEQPVAGAKVTVTNTQTGYNRSTETEAGGNYAIPGLPPGTYKVEVTAPGGTSSQLVALQVGQTATLNLGITPLQKDLESVTVSATQLFETRTSEIANYVSQKQIEALPQNSRNFLAFADIIPGVQFNTKGDGSTELRSGAQAANGVNVFVDGVGQKNYVLRGGVSGQTGSRGNPFPQMAIGEYKVITSNYKAEFDQVSSAAIVAVTRSGTNQFESHAFWDKTDDNWRASDPLEAKAGKKVESKQEQYGVGFGGPIIEDRMHFFVTYEKKSFETPKTILLGLGRPASDAGSLANELGGVSVPFDEDLYFGKIDWSVSDDHLLELTAKVRDESELEAIGDQNTREHAGTKDNKETRIDLRYQYTGTRFLNDAHLTYEDASFNPRPVTIGPGFKVTTGNPNETLLNLGGGENFQDKGQNGYALQDDLTFNEFEWHGAHTVKTGFKFKRVEINAFEQQPYNPQFYLDVSNDLTIPYQVVFGAAIPGLPDRNVTSRNSQFGIYLQDDWEMTDKLLVNLGVRWDYEKTPSYLDYVTPPDVLAGLNTVDPNTGRTYAQTIALGGVNVNDYISTGNNRKAFTGAIQPRLGFSYDLQEDQRHVVFGGAGRSYDRNVFDYIALERSKGTFPTYTRMFDSPGHPCTPGVDNCLAWDPAYLDRANLEAVVAANPSLGREVDLINNDLKTPYADQYSIGIRNRVLLWNRDWNTSATVSYIESKDGIVFLLGNRYPDGSFRPPGITWGSQPFGNGIPGLGSLIVAKNGLETRSAALLLYAEKPYSSESPWGVTLAYTYTHAKENRTNIGSTDEHAIFDYPDVRSFGWRTSTGVPEHRLVATGIMDGPWGLSLSAKLTLSTPLEFEAVDCFDAPDFDHCGFRNFKSDATLGYRSLDLALQKTWDVWSDVSVNLRGDVLNVFNYDNPDSYELWRGGPGEPNATFGNPTAYMQPTRTFKLSFNVGWR
jgi:outer membrane receptor protein involved in Fe transport